MTGEKSAGMKTDRHFNGCHNEKSDGVIFLNKVRNLVLAKRRFMQMRKMGGMRRTATLALTAVLTLGMMPAENLLAAEQTADGTLVPDAAAEDGTASSEASAEADETPWYEQIDEMLTEGDYAEGEALALVYGGAASSAALYLAAEGISPLPDGSEGDYAEDFEGGILDEYGEDIFRTEGAVYEEASGEEIPEAMVSGTALCAGISVDEASSEDVDIYVIYVADCGLTTEEILNELAEDPRVITAQPNYVFEAADEDSLVISGTDGGENDGEDEQKDNAESRPEGSDTADGEDSEQSPRLRNTNETGAEDPDTAGGDSSDETDSSETLLRGTNGTASYVEIAPGTRTEDISEKIDLTGYQYAYNNAALTVFKGTHSEEAKVNLENWNDSSNINSAGVIAICDTGIDYENPDLKDVMFDMTDYINVETEDGIVGGGRYGFNAGTAFDGDETNCRDGEYDGHGTHCAGIAAAAWNEYGVSGAANGAKLLSVKMTDPSGGFSMDAIVKGYAYIERAIEAGVDIRVSSNSWGGDDPGQILNAVVTDLGKKGVLTVFAAGNESFDADGSSTTAFSFLNNPYVVVVDASDMEAEPACYTNYGSAGTHVFAPGSTIISTFVSTLKKYYPSVASDNKAFVTYENEADASLVTDGDGETVGTVRQDYGFDDKGGALAITAGDIKNLKNCVENESDYTVTLDMKLPVSRTDTSAVSYLGFAFYTLDYAKGIGRISLKFPGSEEDTLYDAGKYSMQSWHILSVALDQALGEGQKIAYEQGQTEDELYLPVSFMLTIPKDGFDKLSDDDIVLAFDDIGLGYEVCAYSFLNGTSMATPCISGLAAVASTQIDGYDGMAKEERAKALASCMRSSVRQLDAFEGLCTSDGLIDASKFGNEAAQMPVIESVYVDEDEKVMIKGQHFGDEAGTEGSVSFGGDEIDLNGEGAAWTDTEITFKLPAGTVSGVYEIVLTDSAGHKARFSKLFKLNEEASLLYEKEIEVTEDFPKSSSGVKIQGFDGRLYFFTANELYEINDFWVYDPETETWEELPSPLQEKHAAAVSTTLWQGKILVYMRMNDDDDGTDKELYAYDPEKEIWEDLTGLVRDNDDIRIGSQIVNAGGEILFIGGSVYVPVSEAPETIGEASRAGYWIPDDHDPVGNPDEKIDYSGYTMPKVEFTLAQNNICRLDMESGETEILGNAAPRTLEYNTYYCESADSDGSTVYTNGGIKYFARQYEINAAAEMLTRQDDGTYESQLLEINDDYAGTGCVTVSEDDVLLVGLSSEKAPEEDTWIYKDGTLEAFGRQAYPAALALIQATAYNGWLYAAGNSVWENMSLKLLATEVETSYREGDVLDITVEDGKADVSKAWAGKTVSLKADEAPEGYVFSHWEGNVSPADRSQAETTFIMPKEAVSLKAVYVEKTDGKTDEKGDGKDSDTSGSGTDAGKNQDNQSATQIDVSKTGSVGTGDASETLLYLVMAAAALLVSGIFMRHKKEER